MVGQPLRLLPFQREFILAVYDNRSITRRALLTLGRKNGKTALIATILLAHLVGPEAKQNSQIVSGALSRDQAALVFGLASKMVQLSPRLSGIVRIVPSGKRLIGLPLNVEYRALAAEGKTAHGLSPVLAILDEVGQVEGPQSDFIDAIVTSQGAHTDPLLMVISTQAANDADLLSVWLDDAKRSKDPKIVSHVYAAPPEAGLMDRSGWAAANPALGVFRSLADVEQLATEASRMPSAENTFRNLILNQRCSTFAPFVGRKVWEENGGAQERSLIGAQVWCGLDLSAKTDLTSLIVVARHGDTYSVFPYFWCPSEGVAERAARDRVPYDVWVRDGSLRTTPGKTVDYEAVAADMAEILADCEVRAVAFDRWRMDIFKRDMARIGVDFPLVEFGQGFKDMSPAIDSLEEMLLNGKLRHDMHPVLTMCAANAAVIRDQAGNRKLDKQRATGRIDGMVALSMAVGVMAKQAPETPGDVMSFLRNPIIA